MKFRRRNLNEAATLPDYRTVLDTAKGQGLEPVGTFTTARGSTYAHLPDASTIRYKAQRPTHSDYGPQPKSAKTVFMDPAHIQEFGGVHQNPDIPTRFTPTGPNKAALQYTQDHGPRKAGTTVPGTEFPFETRPRLGLAPVEIWNPAHHQGVHFGSTITHVSGTHYGVDDPMDNSLIKSPDELENNEYSLKEEMPVNNVGGGNVAGLGVGPKGEPGRSAELMPLLKRKKDFAGQAVFEVSSKLFNEMRLQKRDYARWNKYLQEEEGLDEIREYARKNPKNPIILQDENTGCMCYARYGKK